jgi:histidinol-phosphatase
VTTSGQAQGALELSNELDFARDLAALGGKVAMGHFMRDPRRSKKSDGTWVTEADWAVEAQIRLRIARARPEHNVLGEEEGLSSAGGGPPRNGAPTWVVDPIDGTNNYIAGIPVWATLVALRADSETLLGVSHAPALGETYDAGRGLGARFNDAAIRVDPLADLGAATVCCTGAEAFHRSGLGSFHNALIERCYRSRGFADFWGHMLVARGAAHVMVEPDLDVWDVAALQPIVEEAGGRVTHLDGTPWRSRGTCLTTNGVLHDAVTRLL